MCGIVPETFQFSIFLSDLPKKELCHSAERKGRARSALFFALPRLRGGRTVAWRSEEAVCDDRTSRILPTDRRRFPLRNAPSPQ
jgi:hypothetical protein